MKSWKSAVLVGRYIELPPIHIDNFTATDKPVIEPSKLWRPSELCQKLQHFPYRQYCWRIICRNVLRLVMQQHSI